MNIEVNEHKLHPDSYFKIKLGKQGRCWLNISYCRGQWKEGCFHLHNFGLRKGKKIVIEIIK